MIKELCRNWRLLFMYWIGVLILCVILVVSWLMDFIFEVCVSWVLSCCCWVMFCMIVVSWVFWFDLNWLIEMVIGNLVLFFFCFVKLWVFLRWFLVCKDVIEFERSFCKLLIFGISKVMECLIIFVFFCLKRCLVFELSYLMDLFLR